MSLAGKVHEVLSKERAGLITDVDGTISRISEFPGGAIVDPGVLQLLERLSRRLALVALVSGRSVAQVRQMVGIGDLVYVGNHGLEWWEHGRGAVAPEVEPHLGAIRATLGWLDRALTLPGMVVEDKRATGSIHYRLVLDQSSARTAILEAIARCPLARTLKVTEGRKVVNLLPPVVADKGTAVERLVKQHRLQGVVYLGDDVTDLDAFRALRALRASQGLETLAVGVCTSEGPASLASEADGCLEGVGAVTMLLREAESLLRLD